MSGGIHHRRGGQFSIAIFRILSRNRSSFAESMMSQYGINHQVILFGRDKQLVHVVQIRNGTLGLWYYGIAGLDHLHQIWTIGSRRGVKIAMTSQTQLGQRFVQSRSLELQLMWRLGGHRIGTRHIRQDLQILFAALTRIAVFHLIRLQFVL